MNTVLVIEDDKSVRENVCEMLNLEGYNTIQTADGIDGLNKINSEKPDIIICDISIPGINGYDLLNILKNDNQYFDIPFIFLTAKTSATEFREGMNLGADDYITKPYKRTELLGAVNNRLKKKNIAEVKLKNLRDSIKYSLPHEILSPLNVIILSAKMLIDESKTISPEEISQISSILYDSSYNLKKIFYNYLFLVDLHLMSANKAELLKSENDFSAFQDDIIQMVVLDKAKEYNRTKDLEISLDKSKIFINDELLFKLTLEVIDNALKFSKTDDKVIVTGKKNENTYKLTFRNYGSVMSKEQIAQIGEFIQFDRKKNEIPGIGLGLAIVHKICSIFGAQLLLQSGDSTVDVICKFNFME